MRRWTGGFTALVAVASYRLVGGWVQRPRRAGEADVSRYVFGMHVRSADDRGVPPCPITIAEVLGDGARHGGAT